jgi:nucleoside-diphosphate-sugar epimerase
MRLNRRRFLQSSSLAGAPAAAAQTATKQKPVLITSANSTLAQSLASGLSAKYPIRLTERVPVSTTHEFIECALDPDPATNLVVRGIEAIIHAAEPLPGDTAEQQLDLMTRCTYNLLSAAAQESAPRVVLLSTLEVMTGYPANFTVSETWRPRPGLEPRVLAKHLGEFTCREFAREGKVNVVVLRLGKLVRAADAAGRPSDPLWVEENDVIQAVSSALTAKLASWQVFHIQSESPRARFTITRAKAALGYQPRFRW